jgi:aspartokinase-like uncharacterized kinase
MKDEIEEIGRTATPLDSSFILHTSSLGVRVIKLGGSLLDDGDWPEQFRRWLGQQPAMHDVLIVGGGALADAVRGWDRVHGLSRSDSHWLAIDAMSVTSKLAAKLMPEATWANKWQTVMDFTTSGEQNAKMLVFDPSQFLETLEPVLDGDRLPASWDVTSDSIAARIAWLLRASELVLLKSCLPLRAATTLEQASDSGHVDRGFSRFAAGLSRVRFVNLRDRGFSETAWHCPAQRSAGEATSASAGAP